MHILRSRGPQDHSRPSRRDDAGVAIPILDTRRLQSPHGGSSSAASSFSSVLLFLRRSCRVVGELCCRRSSRRRSLLYWYRWLQKRNLVCCAVITLFLLLFLTTMLFSFAVIALTWDHPWTQILLREYLAFLDVDDFAVRVPGAVRPREPSRLWAVPILPPTPLVDPLPINAGAAAKAAYQSELTRQLTARYAETLVLYTFANGTERQHAYRRLSLAYCGAYMQSVELQLALHGMVLDGKGTTELCTTPMQRAKTNAEVVAMVDSRATTSVTGRDRETDELRHSIRSLEQHVQWHRGRVVIVSPGHHPTWVDGAKNFLAGVCGDAAVQALRTRGTHLRLTTVHQDAIMATHGRLTVNTHPIEQQLWRVLNITAVHVYMNDDYFVNRDVAITDLFNEYGGTKVRVESTLITGANTANDTLPSWAEGVSHTNYFTIQELDLQHEDEVPVSTAQLWHQRSDDFVRLHLDELQAGSVTLPPLKGPSQRYALWTMLDLLDSSPSANLSLPQSYTAAEVRAAYASTEFGTVRPHFFATHAPFVYCTNMLRHLATRYPAQYAQSMFLHRSRSSTDLYVPFLYNAFVMARPWEASARFPSFLLLQRELEPKVKKRAVELVKEQRKRNDDGDYKTAVTAAAGAAGAASQGENAEAAEIEDREYSAALRHQARTQAQEELRLTLGVEPIKLDNCDGCAPATMLVGRAQNGCLFGRFSDDENENMLFMRLVAHDKPMFFNVNTGLTTPRAADQLRAFLAAKFPRPLFLEVESNEPSKGANFALTELFSALMQLPVLGIVSYEEGACPLVRSLSLAFAGHHCGRVHVAVHRHGLGEVDATLAEVREELRYAPRTTLPTVGCSFDDRVRRAQMKLGDSIAEAAQAAFGLLNGSASAGVELPSTCGGGGGGLRVRGFVIDARTPHAPLRVVADVHEALAMPGQTLALEDFRAVRVGPEERDVVLVLAREDAAVKAVHWITGASESDLLVTFPLPQEAYEDMNAPIRWLTWSPGN